MHLRAFCLLLLTASACLLVSVEANSDIVDAGDFWDTDEQAPATQSEPVSPPEGTQPQQTPITQPSPDVDLLSEQNQSVGGGSSKSTILGRLQAAQGSYYVEGVFALIAAWFVAGIFTGKESNNKLVKAWVDANLSEGAVLERNFAQLGPGEGDGSQLMMRESPKLFKLWASGRRHCQVSARIFVWSCTSKPCSLCTGLTTDALRRCDNVSLFIVLQSQKPESKQASL